MKKTLIACGMLIFIVNTTIPVLGQDQDSPQSLKNEQEFNLGYFLARFYKTVISPVDGDRCPSLPSCSAYSAEVFKEYGFFIGWMMTVDRLIHEGSEETKVSPLVYQDGKWKILDPIQNNNFWWTNHDQ